MDRETENKGLDSAAKMQIASAISATQGIKDNLTCLAGMTPKTLLDGQLEGGVP